MLNGSLSQLWKENRKTFKPTKNLQLHHTILRLPRMSPPLSNQTQRNNTLRCIVSKLEILEHTYASKILEATSLMDAINFQDFKNRIILFLQTSTKIYRFSTLNLTKRKSFFKKRKESLPQRSINLDANGSAYFHAPSFCLAYLPLFC